MTLSRSLTDLGVIFGLAQQVNDVDLDKITFIKLPVYDLDGEYAGRVAAIPDRSAELFALLASDAPLVLAEANPGTGAVVVEDNAITTETTEVTDPAAPETAAPVASRMGSGDKRGYKELLEIAKDALANPSKLALPRLRGRCG